MKMKCPKCHSLGRFVLVAQMCVWVNEDGTLEADNCSDMIKDDDVCVCDECEYEGEVKDFEVNEKSQKPETRTSQVDLDK